MRDYFKEWNNYFLDKKGNTAYDDKKDEINEVIDYIYKECEYSKKHFRYDLKCVEVNYYEDLDRFNRNIEKYKDSFIDFQGIKKPQKLSFIFATQYTYLTYVGLKEDVIGYIFGLIREEIFQVATAPKIGRKRMELEKDFEELYKTVPTMLEIANLRFKKLRKENPSLTHGELIKLFTETSN